MGLDGGRRSDFPDEDAVREGICGLDPDQVIADLNAVADYVAGLPAANGEVAVAGFCWGSSQTFRLATNRAVLVAAFVFYGTAPEDGDALARIEAPVYGFYGGNDARVSSTIPGTASMMEAAGKVYEPVTYDEAGHGFMRSGEDPNGEEANRTARVTSWGRWRPLLSQLD